MTLAPLNAGQEPLVITNLLPKLEKPHYRKKKYSLVHAHTYILQGVSKGKTDDDILKDKHLSIVILAIKDVLIRCT